MTTETHHVVLVQKKEGLYTVYVFQKDNQEYLMCTKLPNWGVYNINRGDSGFVTVEFVESGDKYLDRETNTIKIYKFDQCYFKEFIPDKSISKEIILQIL